MKNETPQPHETENGYCCACEYDIACMNEKIKEAEQRKVEEIRKEIKEVSLSNEDVTMYGDGFEKAVDKIRKLKSLTNKE